MTQILFVLAGQKKKCISLDWSKRLLFVLGQLPVLHFFMRNLNRVSFIVISRLVTFYLIRTQFLKSGISVWQSFFPTVSLTLAHVLLEPCKSNTIQVHYKLCKHWEVVQAQKKKLRIVFLFGAYFIIINSWQLDLSVKAGSLIFHNHNYLEHLMALYCC